MSLLHRVTSLLQEDKDLGTLLRQLVELLPAGWQFPEMLEARITVADLVVSTRRFEITPWIQRADFPITTRRQVSWKLPTVKPCRLALMGRSFRRNAVFSSWPVRRRHKSRQRRRTA